MSRGFEATALQSSAGESETVPTRPVVPNWLVLAIGMVAVAVMAYPAWLLLRDSLRLQGELSRFNSEAPIGYVGIYPNLSHAHAPGPWLQRDGSRIKLWSGWVEGVGHTWFNVDASDLQCETLAPPFGRDAFPAIDHPLSETGGGVIWDRIPDQSEVVGEHLGVGDSAYPILLLDKVVVINDTIDGQPFLITYNRFKSRENGVAIFNPSVKGKRLTFGHTGYLQNANPIFYDRGTQSLWTFRDDSLVAISGFYKGEILGLLARPTPTSWSEWRRDHPLSRLIIGSDRKKTPPLL